jgi:hypothetical protein
MNWVLQCMSWHKQLQLPPNRKLGQQSLQEHDIDILA